MQVFDPTPKKTGSSKISKSLSKTPTNQISKARILRLKRIVRQYDKMNPDISETFRCRQGLDLKILAQALSIFSLERPAESLG